MNDNKNKDLSNRDLALVTLRDVCLDDSAPAAARAQAAKTLLDALDGGNKKDLSAMSRVELDAEIARLSGK